MSKLSKSVQEALAKMQRSEPNRPNASRRVYLLRGLPGSGKSHTAKRLARPNGVICETDSYFEKQIGNETIYDYDESLFEEARRVNFEKYCHAIDQGVSRIVVDRGNGLNRETCIYVDYAIDHDYELELKEPDSLWWREMQTLLRYRPHTDNVLQEWAKALTKINQQTHQVPLETIKDWMDSWIPDLTIDEIIRFAEKRRSKVAANAC